MKPIICTIFLRCKYGLVSTTLVRAAAAWRAQMQMFPLWRNFPALSLISRHAHRNSSTPAFLDYNCHCACQVSLSPITGRAYNSYLLTLYNVQRAVSGPLNSASVSC